MHPDSYKTTGYAQAERVPEQTTITSRGYEVGKAASRVAVLNTELGQLLDSLRGPRPSQQSEINVKTPAPGTVCGLFEVNLNDLHGQLDTLTAHVDELKRTIGNL